MATNTAPATPPARELPFQAVHYLRKTVAWNDAGIAAGVKFAASLPAAAQIVDTIVAVTTAFNAGTTNVLTVGTTPTGEEIVASATAVAGTLGAKRSTAGVALGPLAGETPVYASYSQTGTAASAGSATIVIAYVLGRP